MTALKKKSTLIVNLIALSCPLLLGTLQTQGVEPPEGPAPTVVPTRIAAPALQDYIPAQNEPVARPPTHPPLESLPPVPMLAPNMGARAPANTSAGPGSIVLFDAGTQQSQEVAIPPAPAGQAVNPAQGGGYKGADGGPGNELLPANFGTMSYLSPASRAIFPYRVNCKLAMRWRDNGGNDAWFVASGSMVDPETVITAGHCVYNRDPGFSNNPWAQEVIVYPGWDGNDTLILPSSTMYPFGWARGTTYASWSSYTSGGNSDFDLGVVKVERAVGFLTGYFGWEYGFDCQANTYNNASYPAEGCGSPGLHTGSDMYIWAGNWDACNGNNGTMWQLNTSPGCFTAVWGGMSGSSAYRIDSGNRYIGAVCSLSDRSSIGLYARFFQGWVEYVWNTFIPTVSRGSTFDLQPLNQQVATTSVPAGGTITGLSHLEANPSGVDPGAANYTYSVYLSSNDTISTSDTLLGTYSFNWDFGAVSSVTVNMFDELIPANTPPGDYWIGVILAPGSDSNSGNNNMAGWDARRITVTCATAPSAPTSVSATDGVYCGVVRVSWAASAGATGYNIYRDGSFAGSSAASPFDDVPGNGSTHSYTVRATYNCGTSVASTANTGYAATTPAVPTGVAASDSTYCGVVRVSWNASTGATSYTVYRDGTSLGSIATSPFYDTPGNASSHSYTVKASNGCGTSSASTANAGTAGNCAHLVVDNADGAPYVQITGAWTAATTSPGYVGADYLHDGNAGKGTKTVTFIPTVATAGSYEVFIWYTAAANRASNLPVDITYSGGSTTRTVNERINGSQWVSLGTYSFAAGTAGRVTLRTTGTDGYVVADAIKLAPPAPPVAHLLVDNTDGASFVQVVGAWTSATTSPGFVGTDYLHDGNAGKGTKTVTFIPAVATTGSYEVFIWYTAAANRASNLPVDITYSGGTTTKTVNERINGSQWVSLGTYSFAAGTAGHVTLRTTGTDGYVVADAIKLAPAAPPVAHLLVDNTDGASFVQVVGAWTSAMTSPGFVGTDYLHDGNAGKGTKTVTFIPTVATTQTYEVFIWYTAAANRASNLPVDITYSGGTITKTVNERINGSQWVSLGTYTFAAGTTGHVTLRTTGTDGYVIADAIKLQ